MSDLISRQDVLAYPIRADHYDREHGNKHFIAGIESVMEYVECLPSAEPKTPSNGSITCVKSEKMHDRTMGDLISREDACEAVKNEMESWLEGDRCDYRNVVDAIMDLPSAEKAQLSEEDATKDATSDLIRRQDAIDAVEFGITYAKAIDVNTGESKELFKEGNDALKKAVERLKELPSAEPERKTGRWLELTNTNHTYVCSVCGRMLVNITDGKNTVTKNYPFCHCGADMRGNSYD